MQNVPIRDEYAKNICRGGIVPAKDNVLLEIDYGSIEVRIAACITKDPSLIKYVTDESTDMHRDSAADIWSLPHDEVTKELRYFAKSCWVFPQFYGSYYVSCAKELWSNCIKLKTDDGKTMLKHLKSIGIKNYEQFVFHCKSAENTFWNKRFKVYTKWKDNIWNEYLSNGMIQSPLGFKFKGLMNKNDVTNYPIQATAFHILLWTLIETNKLSIKEGWASNVVGQVHDSIIVDAFPSEVDHIIKSINKIGCEDVKKEFPWIIIPLIMETETTRMNEPWSKKKELK